MVQKYIRVKPHVMSKVDNFFEREMKDQPVLGVQIRGTDKGFDPNGRRYGFPDYLARIVPPEEYWPIADEFIASYPACKIFVATDQQQFVESFRERYPDRVLSYGDTRSTTTQNSMHVKDGRNYKKGEDVLIDCLLLSRTDFLLWCQSNVGEVATYFNPDLPVIDVQYSRSLQEVEVRIRDKVQYRQGDTDDSTKDGCHGEVLPLRVPSRELHSGNELYGSETEGVYPESNPRPQTALTK